MEKQNNLFKTLKKMKLSNYVYLGIIILFFIIVFILFLYSTSFIVGNINKMFSIENASNIESLDIKSYSLLEKKLNLEKPATLSETEIDALLKSF